MGGGVLQLHGSIIAPSFRLRPWGILRVSCEIMSLRGGRYEILGTIATGGMATVHLGRALGAGGFERLVAIKTMHPHLAAEEEFVAMFLDEARLAARIRHPNVVATVDVQQDDDGLFLVMEYIEGPSLSRLLRALQKKDRRLPLDIGLRIFLEALAGLHAAHELTGPGGEPLHLIHRDVSPHNILVGTDGITRITDFGVARAASRLASTRTGSAKGKLTYMAPEHARSERLDRRADIYSAGVVLWEMLTRERLVRGDSDMAMLQQITAAERKAPHEVFAEIPPEISAVTMRAIDRDQDKRFATAAAFTEALEFASRSCGVAPAPPREVARFVKELEAHIVVSELPPSGSQKDVLRRPLMSLTSGSGHTPDHRPATGSAAGRPGAAPESIPAVGGTIATVALPAAAPSRGSSARTALLVGGGVLMLALGATGALLAFRGGDAGAGAAGGASTVQAPSTAVPTASVPVAPAGPTAADPAASAPDPALAPGATASATATASAKAAGTAAPRGSGAPKTFRPKEL